MPTFLSKTTNFSCCFYYGLRGNARKITTHYYQIYPNDLINIPEDLASILFEHNMTKRGRSMLEIALKEGYLNEENVDSINELTILIWQGMFTNILNNRKSYDSEEATKIVMNYISEIVLNANLFSFQKLSN
ncbi:hypothetical protein LSPCS325_01340 [Lysinibacillus sp. CTST325]